MYIEKLVRFYMKETPILKNIPTWSFRRFDRNGNAQFNQALFNRVFANMGDYVVKRVDGRGGDAVWVGPKVKGKNGVLKMLQELVRAEPDKYIAQTFTPPSYSKGHILDLRLLSDVGPEKILVANTPWGRALPRSGDGKVNISARGSETTVIVTDIPLFNCFNVFGI